VPYVGPTAIDRLRRWAPGWSPSGPSCPPELLQEIRDCVDTAIVEQMITLPDAVGYCLAFEAFGPCATRYQEELAAGLCRADNDCAEPARCQGIPYDGSSVLGLCADTSSRPGEGEQCSATDPCGADLVCAGLTIWETGNCVASWMARTFVVEIPATISQVSGATTETQVIARGLASVPVDVEVEIELDGVDAGRLRLELVDPNGDTAVLWNGDGSTLPDRLVARNGIARDDSVNGFWTLRAITLFDGTGGQIRSWRLHLTSRWD
jgi:hypothetical protein